MGVTGTTVGRGTVQTGLSLEPVDEVRGQKGEYQLGTFQFRESIDGQ